MEDLGERGLEVKEREGMAMGEGDQEESEEKEKAETDWGEAERVGKRLGSPLSERPPRCQMRCHTCRTRDKGFGFRPYATLVCHTS